MAAWIDPLAMETWIVHVFAGSLDIFVGLAMFFIFGMAAYFRMNILTTVFMFLMFLMMFSIWMPSYFILLIGAVGGMFIGRWMTRIV